MEKLKIVRIICCTDEKKLQSVYPGHDELAETNEEIVELWYPKIS